MDVHLTRDSVCMADDMDAPPETQLAIADAGTVRELLDAVLRASYLAGVGGKATWTAHALGGPVAVVSQQWAEPKYVMEPERLVGDGPVRMAAAASR